MNFIFRNIVIGQIFAVLFAFSWIFGGTRSDCLLPVIPWFSVILIEGMLFFPQCRPDEDISDARIRCWHGLAKDSLTYVSLAFVLVLLIPFVNPALCPICDYPAILSGVDPKPKVPIIPFCVNVRDHLTVLLWFVPALIATLAAKHALHKSGKRILLEMFVWNGAALAILGFIQQASNAVSPFWINVPNMSYFFSAWGYPNMAGDFFTFMFALSVGLWQVRVQEIAALPPPHEFDSFRQPKYKALRAHYLLAAAALNFFAAISTLCRAAILLCAILLVVMSVHIFFGYFSKADRLARVKMCTFTSGGFLAILLIIAVFAPKGLMKEVSTITPSAVVERVTGKGQYHVRVAMTIFKDYPLFGVGGWGYKHFCPVYMTEADLKNRQVVGGINVHNDYIQFLCEHGLIGASLILAIFLILLVPILRVWRRLYLNALFVASNMAPAKPYALYCLPSPVMGILLACSATIIHAFGDCPLRSPAVLTAFLVSLACADGFFPRNK